jgi:hypothetical protein
MKTTEATKSRKHTTHVCSSRSRGRQLLEVYHVVG